MAKHVCQSGEKRCPKMLVKVVHLLLCAPIETRFTFTSQEVQDEVT
jgi:hypothetical protein